MRLPLLGPLDPRNGTSPLWSIQNIQFVFSGMRSVEWYGGVKNLLNWTPNKGNPFIIARTNDPFDKQVVYNANGQIQVTPDNPYALSFDPTYVYAPNQGILIVCSCWWVYKMAITVCVNKTYVFDMIPILGIFNQPIFIWQKTLLSY